MKKSLILFCAFLLLNAVNAQNRSIRFENSSWKDILAKARKENKLIYLDAYATWCGPCKWMAKNVFTNDTAADFYNASFINVKMDMEKGEGLQLAKKYAIRAYPTMLFLNADGEQMHRTCGSALVQPFVEEGRKALDPENRLAAYQLKFNSGNTDPGTAYHYFSMLEKGCQDPEAALESYFNARKREELFLPGNWRILHQFANDAFSAPFQFLEASRAEFASRYTADSVDARILAVYRRSMNSERNKAELDSLKERFRATGLKDAEKYMLEADIRYYLQEEDWSDYAAAVTSYIETYNDLPADELNNVAWLFYEHVENQALLAKAAGWAAKAVAQDDKYSYNDTHAAVLYKLGQKDKARAAALHAIELAKRTGEDYKETEALLKKINKR